MNAVRRLLGQARSKIFLAFRYGFVSVVCFITNNLLLIGLDGAGASLWMSLAISAALMILFGFVLQGLFTFQVPLTWKALIRYALVLLPNVPVAYVLLWLLHDKLNLAMHFAAPIVTTMLVLWNAFGSTLAFSRRLEQSN